MPVIKGQEWTFDTVAAQYARVRPGYPAALYMDILAYLPLDKSKRAVEVGIGGGQATEPILRTGCRVTAVEYGAQLTRLCRQRFAAYPGFTAVNARFEEYPHTPACCDLVYSASAFHWIPQEIGYPKVFDMLKSGGAFARFAMHPYKDMGNEALWQAIQAQYALYMPGAKAPDAYGEAQAKARAEVAGQYGFCDIRYRLYEGQRTYTADEYAALLGTYSDHIALGEETLRRFLDAVKRVINDFGGRLTLYDTIDLQLARKP